MKGHTKDNSHKLDHKEHSNPNGKNKYFSNYEQCSCKKDHCKEQESNCSCTICHRNEENDESNDVCCG